MAGERGAVARAVGHDLVALVDQVAVPQLAEAPPDALDVARVHGAVGVLGVEPEADPLGEPLPLVEVDHDRLAAPRVELGDAVGLDLRLARDAELALDLELDRQAMAVPPGLALHVAPAHGLEAREDVLEHARERVVGAGAPVGRGRPLVEHERRAAGAQRQAAREHVALAPEGEHPLLHRPPPGGRPDRAPAHRQAAAMAGRSSSRRTPRKSSNGTKGTPALGQVLGQAVPGEDQVGHLRGAAVGDAVAEVDQPLALAAAAAHLVALAAPLAQRAALAALGPEQPAAVAREVGVVARRSRAARGGPGRAPRRSPGGSRWRR